MHFSNLADFFPEMKNSLDSSHIFLNLLGRRGGHLFECVQTSKAYLGLSEEDFWQAGHSI